MIRKGMLFFVLVLTIAINEHALAKEEYSLQAGTYEVLSKVRQDMEKFDYSSARKKLLPFLQTNLKEYDKAIAYQTLGYIENGLGNFKAATDAFEQSLKTNTLPDKVEHELLYATAQLLIHQEQPEKGLKYLSRWFIDEPKPEAEAHIVAASAYYQMKDYQQLIIHVEKALGLSSSPPMNWYELLLAAYFETKNYSKAAPLLETIIARFPDNRDHWLQLASVYQQLNQGKRALAVYELAYNRELLKSEDIEQLVRMYLYLEMPFKAATVMEKELAIGGLDDNKDNLILLGDSWLLAQEKKKAEDIFKEVVSRYDDKQIRLRLGQLYIEQEQWQDAVQLLNIKPGTKDKKLLAKMSLLLGIAQFHVNDLGKATNAFNRALSDKSTEDQARWWLDYVRKQSDSDKAG